jgi:putative transcriptional regulator
MQEVIAASVLKILRKAGYAVTDLVETRPRCFDIVAKKESVILLVKVLYNIDSFKPEMAEEMKIIAKLLKASPVVVGEKFKFDYLERGVVYTRYGLPVINTATFYDFVVEEVAPLVYSAPGGYYVRLDSERIRSARERLGISIGDIARHLGISRRAAKKYEEGVDTSVENALKLEEILGTYVMKEIDVLNFVGEDVETEEIKEVELQGKEAEIVEQLRCIGVKVYPIKHAPFDAVAKTDDESILTGVKQVKTIEKRAEILGRISETVAAKAAYIVEKMVNKEVGSVIFVMKEELECVSSAKDFLNLLDEKKLTERYI